jgi:hypothetical protein
MKGETVAQQNIFNRIIYLGDKAKFYDTKGKAVLEREEACNLLLQMGAQSAAKASMILDMAKDMPVNSASYIKGRDSVQATYSEVYQMIKPVLGLSKFSTAKASFLYKVDERGEVTFAGQNKVDRFEELIVLNDDVMDIIDAEYKARPELAVNSKIYLVRALFEHFRLDRDLLFKYEPPLLAYGEGPAFKVIEPSEYEPGEHAAWDEFLTRVDYPETFKAYVWSLLDPTNFGRQALWIYGEGNDGKSTIINTLIQFYGRDYTLSLGHKTVDETFFFGQAYGKRLAVYMDCKNLQILQKERVKSLLGKDNVAINDKHDKVFTGQVYSKLFICSNSFPKISFSDRSERTRLLLVKVKSYDNEDGDPDFQDKLLDEMPAFLNSCRESYENECPRGMSLRVPPEMSEDIALNCVTEDSEMIEDFCESHLEFGEQYSVSTLKLRDAFKDYTYKHWAGARNNVYTENDLLKYLYRLGCKKHRPSGEGVRRRSIKGVRVKEVK